MIKKIKLLKELLFLTVIAFTFSFVSINEISAGGSDVSGDTTISKGNCGSDSNSCWIYISNDINEATYGIRATIVDGTGTAVSKSVDFLGEAAWTNIINNNTTYYRCINTNEVKNRLSYLNGKVTCSWKVHNGTNIAKTLDWLPDIYDVTDAAQTIKTTIIGMSKDNLKSTFFDDMGYTIPTDVSTLKKHYLIIEPLTLINIGNYNYYGTYYELEKKIDIDTHFIWSVITQHMPASIYISGNTKIGGPGGYNSTTESYFGGKLKISNWSTGENGCYYERTDGKGWAVYKKCVQQLDIGYGVGLFWMPDFENIKPATCDYNNAAHFSTENSGPNEENCCTYVKDNLSTYNISEAQLYTKYPQCNETLKSCTFNLTIKNPVCNVDTTGTVADITNWNCIYASAYSNDTTLKNYFLKYGKPTDSCSVYCRNEISYMYPNKGVIALAGNYFTIGNAANSYFSYVDPSTNTIKVNAATLGPVQVSVTKDCAILGDINDETCKTKLEEELNDISAPTLEFAYESDYYNNPKEILTSSSTSKTSTQDGVHSKTVTYNYYLPDSTYKYVSKNSGISYKNISSIGKYPYIEIGSHSPIHFSHPAKTNNFQLTIKKFNLPNFDNLVLNGKTMSTKFNTSIETYIKTLINNDQARPTYINGIYYLDKTFVAHLNRNGFSAQDLLNSTCANTNNYNCYSNENGIYCYDKNTTSNSEQTYAYFNSCINSQVQKIKYDKESYKNDMLYECTFEVDNAIINSSNNNNNGIEVIYRTISLDNPFPSIDGDGRATGANWCYLDDCSNTNQVVQEVITNNRDVKTEEIYIELDPLYTITLTPALIKEIRKYNRTTNYDDFNLECNSNGTNCKSKLIRESINYGKYDFSDHFSGCGISNKSQGLKCLDIDKW